MADLLQTGAAWLHQQRAAHMASSVTYRRAGYEAAEVSATYGETTYEVADQAGALVEAHVMDFLITATDLAAEPEPGDVIVAEGRTFEVMPLAGDGAWRFSDRYRTVYRIHTRDTGPDT